MKCPFLATRKDMLNEEGKKIGEEIELHECVKNECMVFDGNTKLCSLLSSNMKSGILIDDIKNGIKDIKEEMYQRFETIGVVISTTIQTLQEALLGRFDILKKQNEIMVLGFDRLLESINNKFEGIKSSFSDYSEKSEKISEDVNPRLDVLKESLEKLIATNQGGMEIVTGTIGRVFSTNQEVLTKLGQLDTLVSSIYSMNDLLKVEIAGLKTEGVNILNGILAKFGELSTAFADIMKPGIDNMTEFMRTEIAGLKTESLNALSGISTKFDELGEFKDSILAKFNEISNIFSESAKMQGQGLQDLVNNLGIYIGDIKSEITHLKTEQIASLNNIQGAVIKLEDLFKQSSGSLGSMSDMMHNLNKNYIESLGKIAGLAEGMRKGVEEVGDGMHSSVKDLVKEMKNEIGALEQQYEKTFGDIANLSGKFNELNTRIREMTKEVEKEFKDSFKRQAQLSGYTKTILEHIKEYFVREEARYKEEQELQKKKEALDHFDRAALYYYRGNYEIAVNEINKALEIDKTAEYLNLKGLLLTELGQFEESKKTYKEALKIEPDLAEIHNNLGLLYMKMKKLGDAVVSFQEAVKKNVNYARAYVNLGKALIESEKYDDAIKTYEKALEIDPSNKEAAEAIKLYRQGKIGE